VSLLESLARERAREKEGVKRTSDHHSKKPTKATICALAANGSASHCSGGERPAAYDAVSPPPWSGNGKWMPLACTQNPTNAAIATRECLISD